MNFNLGRVLLVANIICYFFLRKNTDDLIADALEFMYTPWPDKNDNYALRQQLANLIGDYLFYAPSHEVADIHSQFAAVYMHEFSHRAKASTFPIEP